MAAPRRVGNRASLGRAFRISGRESARCRSSQCCASSPNGTRRSFEPLPVTRNTPCARLTCVGVRPTNSETRNPVAYSTSSMARSRSPSAVATSGTSSRASTSASLRASGNRRPSRGDSTFAQGSADSTAVSHLDLVEASESRQPPCHGSRRRGCVVGNECEHIGPRCDAEVAAARIEPTRETLQIRPIGNQGIARQSTLHPQSVEKHFDASQVGGHRLGNCPGPKSRFGSRFRSLGRILAQI